MARSRTRQTTAPAPELEVRPPAEPPLEPGPSTMDRLFSRTKRAPAKKTASRTAVPVELDEATTPVFNEFAQATMAQERADEEADRLKNRLKPLVLPLVAQKSKEHGHLTPSLVLTTPDATGNFSLVRSRYSGTQELKEGEEYPAVLEGKLKKAGLEGEAVERGKSLFRHRRLLVVSKLTDLQYGSADDLALFERVMDAIGGVVSDDEWNQLVEQKEYVEVQSDCMERAVATSKSPDELAKMLAVLGPTTSFTSVSYGTVRVEVTEQDTDDGWAVSGGGWTAIVRGLEVQLRQDGVGVVAVETAKGADHARNLARKVITNEARREEMIREHRVAA